MTAQRSESLFHRALDQAPPAREQYVLENCGGDWDLYSEVMKLLRYHEDPESLFRLSPLGDGELESVLQDHFLSNFPPGTELHASTGSYRIVRLAGEGGMGFVYQAEQIAPLRRSVAFKVIKLALNGDRVIDRFESEKQALARMGHPYIAGVFEAGTTNEGRPFFTMEYVPGLPISEFCDRRKLSITERIELMIKVCEGVQHAHLKGVVHRDLKPSNILVVDEDGEVVPKVIDFGVAKALDHRLVEHSIHTRTGLVVGTIQYISPEQVDPRIPDLDTRSDVYSLGTVLYELVVGRHPLGLDSTSVLEFSEIERRILDMPPLLPRDRIDGDGAAILAVARNRSTTPSGLRRRLRRPELGWILAKALEKDRSRRYASAADLAEDLKRFLGGDIPLAGPPKAAYRLRRMMRRHWRAMAGVTAVLGTLGIGLIQSTGLYIQNRRVEQTAREQLATVLRLSDQKRLEQLLAAVDSLAPARPEKIPAMEDWLKESEDVLSRLPVHVATLKRLKTSGEAIRGQLVAQSSVENTFQVRLLTDLIRGLRKFADPDIGVGTMAAVRARLEFARRVRHDTIETPALAWAQAIEAIADSTRFPRYHGLRLEPQLGLVPLGPDPQSGLWEFYVPQTGIAPERTATGVLEIREETGLVMVLIPGGTFYMGATNKILDIPAQVGDSLISGSEKPPHQVTLDPFFISKYEMTQAQWVHVFGDNPSEFPQEEPCTGVWRPWLHPVENVTWNQASVAVNVMGLTLPTEAQWECAARGGTTSPWWSGWDWKEMRLKENFTDNCYFMHYGSKKAYPGWVDDGYPESAPVGSFSPNPYGLYDTLGNVFEWCRDYYGSYKNPVATGTGLRLVKPNSSRVFRGGCFALNAMVSRVSRRFGLSSDSHVRIGVRPARPVESLPPAS